MAYSKQVPAAARTLRLLETLATAPDGLSAGELAARLALSRSTLFALLNTLKARRYVEQDRGRGHYRVGPALWTLIPARRRGLEPLIEAFRADVELAALPETVALAWLDGGEAVIVAQTDPPRRVRVVFKPGERFLAHANAAGLVLLAGLPPTAVAALLPPKTENIAAAVQRIQTEGLAQTTADDVVTIACPVCPDGTRPAAALLAGAPAFRCRQTEIAALEHALRQGAARLSYRLGAPVYRPYGWAAGQPLGPTQPLERAEIEQFLRGAWGARLACVRRDGTPHVVPVWYEWDGQYLWVTASPNAFWKAYITGSNRVSVTVDEPWPPLRRALIIGRAEPVPEAGVRGGLAGLRRRLARRYLGQGADRRAEFNRTAGWEAFRIVPHKVTGRQGLGT
ncbi:MAG: helix-turn-helix domain-containing protein [Anaerolineae bacterium]